MNRIIIDNETKSRLGDCAAAVELCDESGRVLARLTPVFTMEDALACEPAMTEEELQRRINSEKWYTTQEVLDHLESL